MKTYTIVVAHEPEEGGYSVAVPALPGCYTQEESFDEAVANAREAIDAYPADVLASGEAIPDEDEPPRLVRVRVRA